MTKTHTKLIRYTLLPLMATITLWSAEPFANNFCQNSSLNIPATECEALHDLWDEANGVYWNHQDGWGVDANVSSWYGITLTTDSINGKKSVDKIILSDNNLTALTSSLNNLSHLRKLIVDGNHLRLPIADLSRSVSLKVLNLGENDLNGTLSTCETFPENIEKIGLFMDHLVGSVPSCFNNFTDLTTLYLSDNNLSGPLPDLFALTQLTTLHLEHNQFTFADFEPQMEKWLKRIGNGAVYVQQRGHYDGVGGYYDIEYEDPRDVCQDYYVDENRTVYFDHTLRIEPRIPANTYSDHDYFAWYKENGTDEGQLLPNGGQRLYLKENATAEDAGYYYYEANNSVVTVPDPHLRDTDLYYCSTPRQYGIHALHDAAPRWGNAALPEGVATVGVTYRYSSSFSDADDTPSVTLSGNPGWLSLTVTDGNFTLSGTPPSEAAGKDYNLTLTLTDAKLPQTRHWLLHVNTADLPDGITHEGETYTHDATHTTVQAPHAWLNVSADDTLRFTHPCEHTATAYATLTGGGTLTSGYRTCETNATTPTLQGSYPAGTILTLSPEMIEADVNLSTTITMGEH